MLRVLFLLLVGLLWVPVTSVSAVAADLSISPADGEPSAPVRRHVRRVEPRHFAGCPDRYSCYPLYGAYGPYGGVAYWTAYTGRY
jgi:hypothetical protein